MLWPLYTACLLWNMEKELSAAFMSRKLTYQVDNLSFTITNSIRVGISAPMSSTNFLTSYIEAKKKKSIRFNTNS